ncbi:MAG: ABC transporter ATP-binding protein [Synergistota bacterium]|nr:ABC transporter ATP-binding protein [Synergistota bacterium]
MNELSALNVTKTFGPFTAVDDLSLTVKGGTIHAIVGENGAGKSTLMKCLYGIYHPDGGSFRMDDKPLSIGSPRDAMGYGIGMVHQHFMLVPSMSVCRNVVLGDEPKRGVAFDLDGARTRVGELIDRYELDISPDVPVGDLPVGRQQQVEILKLLYRRAEILVFDEPTAVLSPKEVDGLFQTIRGFREEGRTVIFIAHNLGEVLDISDIVSVMRKGRLIDTKPASELDRASLAELMVGRSIDMPSVSEASRLSPDPILELKSVSVSGAPRPLLEDVSLEVFGGEILGIAGITGNGQSELEEVLSGLRGCEGTVVIDGLDVSKLDSLGRRNLGLAYIPEDRIRTGLASLADLVDNTLMGYQYDPRFAKGIFRNYGASVVHADSVMERYGVAAAHRGVQAGTLSGGNMQRLVMGRELEHDPKVLLVSQPTRGVDIGGAEEIHRHILDLRSKGSAVLLISSDLDEVLSLSDRVAVMLRGRIVSVLSSTEATRDRVGRIMLEGREDADLV